MTRRNGKRDGEAKGEVSLSAHMVRRVCYIKRHMGGGAIASRWSVLDAMAWQTKEGDMAFCLSPSFQTWLSFCRLHRDCVNGDDEEDDCVTDDDDEEDD